jgi:acetate kinase
MPDAILVLNAGSSSLKFSIFAVDANHALTKIIAGQAEQLTTRPYFYIKANSGNRLFEQYYPSEAALKDARGWSLLTLLNWLEQHLSNYTLVAVGHRVLHGGEKFTSPTRINVDVIEELQKLIPLGPLHQPHNIDPMRLLLKQQPQLMQVACFDTAFHTSMPFVAHSYALPPDIAPVALKRYGFHGLSYEYIAQKLPEHIGEQAAQEKIIIAHLGYGASLCALSNLKSIATTMGFTALEGVPMGTRCGSIDPGILLYLMAEQNLSFEELTELLYHRSGLLGVSGISSDVRTLLQDNSVRAKQALELFSYRVQREIGSLTAALGGLDTLVFTGGIGENAYSIRADICKQASWLGIKVNEQANRNNQLKISSDNSKVSVLVIPTNEELIIAQHTWKICQQTIY